MYQISPTAYAVKRTYFQAKFGVIGFPLHFLYYTRSSASLLYIAQRPRERLLLYFTFIIFQTILPPKGTTTDWHDRLKKSDPNLQTTDDYLPNHTWACRGSGFWTILPRPFSQHNFYPPRPQKKFLHFKGKIGKNHPIHSISIFLPPSAAYVP